MALKIPNAGLQLEEDFVDHFDHLPTQAFVLDLSDDVIESMIESVNKGLEIRLSLGNTPTFLYGSNSHHIEPTVEDDADDIELFAADAHKASDKAERLPQLAMSLFRKPELGNPWAQYRTSSSEDEDDEYDEEGYSPETDDPTDQQSFNDLNSDIALLRNSLAQKEAEKLEKSAKVIEGNGPVPKGKHNAKRAVGSLQKALSGKRSPFNRASLSPLPGSPALSAIGSPSFAAADSPSQQAAEKAKQARSPILHELAFKEQSYDMLWQKYPGASEAEFKTCLDKVADLDKDTQNYRLRKKYWKELDVWHHDYESGDERQQAIDNAIRQYDKMRLSTSDPEWDMLLPKEQRGQGRILSKIHASIAKGPAPRIRVQLPDDSTGDSAGGNSGSNSRDESGGSSRADEEGATSDALVSPSRQTTAAAKKKISAREAQEKRLLSTKKKVTTSSSSPSLSSTKVSPTKAPPKAVNNDKPTKFKSKEFISDSDTSDSESESAPLSATVHQSKLASSSIKASITAKLPVKKNLAAPPPANDRPRKEASTAPVTKKAKPPPPLKETIRSQITAKPMSKKRPREDDDDSSSGSGSSSSGTPLSKRIKPLKPAPKAFTTKEREKYQEQRPQRPPPPPLRAANGSPHDSSSSGGGGNGNGNGNGNSSSNGNSNTNGASSLGRPKNNNSNTSPAKSSPLASSPPTNASEIDLSSEESVPPIGSTNTNKKRKMVDERRNNMLGIDSSSSGNGKIKKRRHLPDDLVKKAHNFKVYYAKYEALYKDISTTVDPPKNMVAKLLAMHQRLQEMKTEIHNEALGQA